jgi:hypothetical protein
MYTIRLDENYARFFETLHERVSIIRNKTELIHI